MANRAQRHPSATHPAKARYEELLALARKTFPSDATLAKRYALLAHKLSLRHRLKPGFSPARAFCKECKTPLIPGVSAKVRAQPSKKIITWTCLTCGHVKRFGYSKR